MAEVGKIKGQVELCLEEFAQGKLTEASLQAILDAVNEQTVQGGTGQQQLLFLRTNGSTVSSEVVGMLLLEDGEFNEGPVDPKDWPYQTTVDAIQDGWRIIKFPELALWVDETRTYEVGGEFVLEKWDTK